MQKARGWHPGLGRVLPLSPASLFPQLCERGVDTTGGTPGSLDAGGPGKLCAQSWEEFSVIFCNQSHPGKCLPSPQDQPGGGHRSREGSEILLGPYIPWKRQVGEPSSLSQETRHLLPAGASAVLGPGHQQS